MPNISCILQAQFVVTDTTLSPSPEIITRSLNNLTLAATTSFYDPFFQTVNGTKAVTLPGATVWLVYVRNLSSTGNITVSYVGIGGGSQNLVLVAGASAGNGGVFIYMQPAESAGGITSLSLVATAVLPACVLVAG